MNLGLGIGLGFGGAPAAAAWTPAKLAGLVAWFDAGSTGGVDGANLAAWTDLSGAGFDLDVQPAGTNIFHANGGPNSKPYVAFSTGPLQRLTPLITGTDAARTYYAVIQRTTDGHASIFDGENGYNGFALTFGLNGLNKREILLGGYAFLEDTTANDVGAWEQIGFFNVGGGAQRMRIGGAEHTLAGLGAVVSSTTAFSIGGNDQGFQPDSFVGNVAEFIGCTGVLSAGDIALVETYLFNKYGV